MGVFPLCWKSCYLITLRKCGNRRLVLNYRGMAKLRNLSKLFERIVTKQLVLAIKTSISPFQHALLKDKSTATNLLEFTFHVFKAFSCASQTSVVYTDFIKAFDRVNAHFLKWTASLQNASFRVLLNSVSFDNFPGTSRSSQNSHLEPFIFIFSINELSLKKCKKLSLTRKIALFAE